MRWRKTSVALEENIRALEENIQKSMPLAGDKNSVALEEISGISPPKTGGQNILSSSAKVCHRHLMKSSESPLQLDLKNANAPKATGDVLDTDSRVPATVPVPLPVVMVRVEGPFTALDRKLWLVLLHNAWHEMEHGFENGKKFHSISIAEVLRLFRKFGRTDLGKSGPLQLTRDRIEDTEAAPIWDSLRRLVKTTVQWEDDDYLAISALLGGALITKKYRQTGNINYDFGPILTQNILLPRTFARLKVHVILKLRSKYAVTLYEILESYVNRQNKECIATIEQIKSWLKVPDDAYKEWIDLRRNVIEPAIKEINEHADEAGFTVAYEGIREGKGFTKIKFTVSKTRERANKELFIKEAAKRKRGFKPTASTAGHYEPTDAVLNQLREIAPGWDRQALLVQYREWIAGKPAPKNPHGAFIGWCKKVAKETRLT